MNERIRELAEHCDFYVGNEHYEKSYEEKQRIWTEKFAELVIAECIQVMKANEQLPVGFLQAQLATTHEVAIHQHFGMETKLSDHAKWSIENFGSPNGA